MNGMPSARARSEHTFEACSVARGHRVVVLASLAAGTFVWLIRPRLLTWGATVDEVSRSYPTDELIPGSDGRCSRWQPRCRHHRRGSGRGSPRWEVTGLVGTAGTGSITRGYRVSDRIVPEWQKPKVGQHLQNSRDGSNSMIVTLVEPNRTLALRANMEFPSRRFFDPTDPLPRVYMDGDLELPSTSRYGGRDPSAGSHACQRPKPPEGAPSALRHPFRRPPALLDAGPPVPDPSRPSECTALMVRRMRHTSIGDTALLNVSEA